MGLLYGWRVFSGDYSPVFRHAVPTGICTAGLTGTVGRRNILRIRREKNALRGDVYGFTAENAALN